jgi:hypothetical protein
MKTATLPAPRTRVRTAVTTAAPTPRRRPMSKKQFERLLAEEKRIGDKAAIGDVFRSPFGGLVIKTQPFTEEDVYACY